MFFFSKVKTNILNSFESMLESDKLGNSQLLNPHTASCFHTHFNICDHKDLTSPTLLPISRFQKSNRSNKKSGEVL